LSSQPDEFPGGFIVPTKVLPPPPFGFTRRHYDEVINVKRLAYDDHPVTRRRPRGSSPSQKAGLRYQRKVCAGLGRVFRDARRKATFHEGQWLAFTTKSSGGYCYCQPDLVVECADDVYVIEIKLSSTTDAWWQLVHQYGPIVRRLYGKEPRLVNVVKNFNPDVEFPDADEWTLCFDPTDVTSHKRSIVPWRL
jgi:hypothetical protein